MEPLTGPTYAQGLADGKRIERQAIVASFDKTVTPYIIRQCDTRESFLPDHGTIPLKQMARAREREMVMKKRCAKILRVARRAYADTLWKWRHE